MFANSCGLIFQKEGAGVVEAIGPQVQVTSNDTSVMYQGDLIVGRLAMGADYLNPAAAVEFVCCVDPSVASGGDYLVLPPLLRSDFFFVFYGDSSESLFFIHMPAPTTIDLDTELSAVNSILGSIGQSPSQL